MNDLRRIGKTQIMVKMHAEPVAGWVSVKCDLGGCHTAGEFAAQAFRMSSEALGSKKRNLRRMRDLLGKAAGLELAGLIKLADGTPAPWKDVLRHTFADIEDEMTSLGPAARMVFFWDEVPYLLSNIATREGPAIAMEVLDVLRALGQDHDRIRLLLTGSIGMHHILSDLKKEGYLGSPLNRMELVQPGPLAAADAIALSQSLMTGNEVSCDDLEICAAALATAVGHVPFYIHKLISRLPRGATSTKDSIEALLDREITSDNNDWDLQHYRDRLKPYYGPQEKLAVLILDALALNANLTFHEIREQINAQAATDDETLRQILKLLCNDNYLTRTEENTYQFYLILIRRWWRLNRSLQA